MHAGIDFGARRSGKTAVCVFMEDEWVIEQSNKGIDSDKFIESIVHEQDIRRIFIDAPLSLPSVFTGTPGANDYFYRSADREVSAMSPMFLGGLTARAIRHKDYWLKEEREVFEAYPAGLVREWDLGQFYKKDKEAFLIRLKERVPMEMPDPENWHQVDALLAWLTGWRYEKETFRTFGDPGEGLIIV